MNLESIFSITLNFRYVLGLINTVWTVNEGTEGSPKEGLLDFDVIDGPHCT